MDDLSTVARPYAQAALAQAREENALGAWSEQLAFLASIVRDPTLALPSLGVLPSQVQRFP